MQLENWPRRLQLHWDDARGGFAVTKNNVEQIFFKAKDAKWDRGSAQELAKAAMVKLRSEAIAKQQKIESDKYEYERPLSNLEQEWTDMTNRFMSLNNKELARWTNLLQVIRNSLRDGTHPAIKHENK